MCLDPGTCAFRSSPFFLYLRAPRRLIVVLLSSTCVIWCTLQYIRFVSRATSGTLAISPNPFLSDLYSCLRLTITFHDYISDKTSPGARSHIARFWCTCVLDLPCT